MLNFEFYDTRSLAEFYDTRSLAEFRRVEHTLPYDNYVNDHISNQENIIISITDVTITITITITILNF